MLCDSPVLWLLGNCSEKMTIWRRGRYQTNTGTGWQTSPPASHNWDDVGEKCNFIEISVIINTTQHNTTAQPVRGSEGIRAWWSRKITRTTTGPVARTADYKMANEKCLTAQYYPVTALESPGLVRGARCVVLTIKHWFIASYSTLPVIMSLIFYLTHYYHLFRWFYWKQLILFCLNS